jgi:hypothetical protein
MTIVVIDIALLGVSEHLIGLGSLFEAFLCFFASWIAVGVVFQGKLPIIRLDLFGRGIPINTKDIVVVSL